ncbi:MAG TPA: hypothetical protein PLD92_04505 [Candidatus Omnitrophota bacterium]|nr:hypothetical protein [Candidatus Omnitrophota bacterium]
MRKIVLTLMAILLIPSVTMAQSVLIYRKPSALGYPSGVCGDGEYIYGIGETIFCSTPPGNAETYWTMNELDENTIYPSFDGYDVVIGGTAPLDSAKFSIKGVADQVQMLIRGNSTQTNAIIKIQKSDETTIFEIDNDGTIIAGDGTDGGSIGLKELAAAPEDVPGYGRYWVRDDGVAMFTYNEVDYELTGSGVLHDEVTLAGQDYLSLDGQEITAGLIKGADINWTTINQISGLNINWTTIDQIGDANINWTDLRYLNDYINWPAVNEVILSGINWEAYLDGGEDINWAVITELDLTGINWEYYAQGGGINWTTLTEAKLDGINWAYYAGGGGEEVNWADITELDLIGINWPYYANGDGINWTTVTEQKLDGINWTDYDITHPAEMANADFGAFTCASGSCTLDSASATNFTWYLHPEKGKLPSTNPMVIDSNTTGRWAGRFDSATDECAQWHTMLYPYNGGVLKFRALYSMNEANTGTKYVSFAVSLMCVSPGDSADVDTDSFGTVDYITDKVNNTAGYLSLAKDDSLNGDACAEFDIIVAKVCRDADASGGGTDDATGDLELREGLIYE